MSIVFNGHTVAGAPPPSDTANAAKKADLTSIIATGATNATGATITSGTYFYLNGTLAVAKADIASGATFTENTNYEAVTAGGLNSLKSAFSLKTEASTSDVNTAQNAILSAYQKASMFVLITGRRYLNSSSDCGVSLLIPIAAVSSIVTYFQNGDSYNGTSYDHLQVSISTSICGGLGYYVGSNLGTNVTYLVQYI